MANCNYKVNLTDIQNKYKFKIFNTGSYNDSDLRKMIESVFYALPRTTGTGTSVTLNDTAFSYMKNKLYVTETSQPTTTGKNKFNPALLSQEEGYNTYDNATGLWTTNDGSLYYRSVFYNVTGGSSDRDITKLLKLNANTQYTLKIYDYASSSVSVWATIAFIDSEGHIIGENTTIPTTHILTFTTPNQECYLDIRRGSNSGTIIFSKIQIEEGDSATDFEEYTGGIASPNPDYPQTIHTITGNNKVKSSNSDNLLSNSVLLTLGDKEICKIGNYEDKIFKAIKGDEIYDSLSDVEKATLDYGKWYLRKNIGKVVLDGTETWNNDGGGAPFRLTLDDANVFKSVDLPPLCYVDKFLGVSYNANWTNYNSMVSTTTYTETNRGKYLKFRYTDISTLADFKTWLSTHNTIVYYVLATPTNEKFNDTIQDQLEDIYNNMLSYEGQTNVSQVNDDLPFNINSTAIKDLNDL